MANVVAGVVFSVAYRCSGDLVLWCFVWRSGVASPCSGVFSVAFWWSGVRVWLFSVVTFRCGVLYLVLGDGLMPGTMVFMC